MPSPFHTPLCTLLGIEHPILQSGMRGVATPELVAEVSRAGGLGIIAALEVPPDELRRQIARVRELTDRPFGVNLWLHEAMQPPFDPNAIPSSVVSGAQHMLNRFRAELGIAAREDKPAPVPDLLPQQLDVILDERVAVFSVGLGDPGPERVERCHARGVRVVAMASTMEDARTLDRSGVDVIVAQGSEAGGHRSTWTKTKSPQVGAIGTMTLVPEIVDVVRAPVVAAGGIADGRGLVAALALGAQGVLLGTRFVATRESKAPEFFKRSILDGSSNATRVTDVFTGIFARGIENRFVTDYEASGSPILPPLLQRNAAQDIYAAATKQGDREHVPMLAGQSMGLIHDLPGAAEIVKRLIEEAARARTRIQSQ